MRKEIDSQKTIASEGICLNGVLDVLDEEVENFVKENDERDLYWGVAGPVQISTVLLSLSQRDAPKIYYVASQTLVHLRYFDDPRI